MEPLFSGDCGLICGDTDDGVSLLPYSISDLTTGDEVGEGARVGAGEIGWMIAGWSETGSFVKRSSILMLSVWTAIDVVSLAI